MNGLFTLTALLRKHYGTKVIILIDEYDVPLVKANEKGYYDQMVSLIHTTGDTFELVIPNMEIRKIFTRQIMDLFKENIQRDGATLNLFCEAVKNGDSRGIEAQFTEYLKKTISIRDTFFRILTNAEEHSLR